MGRLRFSTERICPETAHSFWCASCAYSWLGAKRLNFKLRKKVDKKLKKSFKTVDKLSIYVYNVIREENAVAIQTGLGLYGATWRDFCKLKS
jgi:hypothetical protein